MDARPSRAVPDDAVSGGHSGCIQGRAHRLPSLYERNGTAKLLTLFHPASGALRVHGVQHCTNAILHPWLKQEVTQILAPLPELPPLTDPQAHRAQWQAGLSAPITLPERLPPLRLLLVLDNLQGHKTPALVLWLFAHGIMPLYTPLGGSWLNMTESISTHYRHPRAGRPVSAHTRTDHYLVGSDRRGLEP